MLNKLNMYDLLFYSFHCLVNKKDAFVLERVGFLVSMVTFFIYLSLIFFLIVLLNIRIPQTLWIIISVIFLGYLNSRISDSYFKKPRKIERILEKYRSRSSKLGNTFYSFMALLFFFGSISLFLFSGITLSKHFNPW